MEWYFEVIRKYSDFQGRARRKEYWFFALFNALIGFVFFTVVGIVGAVLPSALRHLFIILFTGVFGLYWLGVLVPSLAVGIRRLHDTGRSGWWLLIGLVPFFGGIILLVFHLLDSEPGTNEYGPNPKGVAGYMPPNPIAPPY